MRNLPLAFCVLLGFAVAAAATLTPESGRSRVNLVTAVPTDWMPAEHGAALIKEDDMMRDEEQRIAKLLTAQEEAAAFRNAMQWANDAREAKRINDWVVAVEYAEDVLQASVSATSGAAGEAVIRSYQGGGYCSYEFLSQFGFNNIDKAVRVCMCESGGDPGAVSPSGLHLGIFQLDSGHRNAGGGTSPESQAAYVANYTNANGWGPWECQ